MLVEDTTENRRLLAAVRKGLAADAHVTHGRALLWRGATLAVASIGIGAGVALGCLGFAALTDKKAHDLKAAGEVLERAVERLNGARLTVAGTVGVEPDAKVALASGGTVAISPSAEVALKPGGVVGLASGGVVSLASGGVVRLDPDAKVGLKIEQLPDVLGRGSLTERTPNGDSIRREVTVFSTVAHADGEVVTGWRYPNGAAQSPDAQYCYFMRPGPERTGIKIDIAVDGHGLSSIRSGLVPELEAAVDKCQWWHSGN